MSEAYASDLFILPLAFLHAARLELAMMQGLRLILCILVALPVTRAVKSHDFKTCSQAGFCRRGRALAARARENPSWKSPYTVDPETVVISPTEAAFTAGIRSAIYPEVNFSLDVRVHNDGVVRVRMDEVGGLRKRYDEAASWALIAVPEVSQDIQWTGQGRGAGRIR